MPLFYFVVKAGVDRLPDPEGIEFPDEQAARAYAIAVARELMRHRDASISHWRLEVCDDYLIPRFEILFAEVNDTIDHLLPEYRQTVEGASRSTASLHEAISRVYTSIDQVRATLASADELIAALPLPRVRPHPLD